MTAVYIVTQEKVIGLRWISATVEMVEKVLKLAMDVSQDVDWRYKLQQDGLLFEHSLGGLD